MNSRFQLAAICLAAFLSPAALANAADCYPIDASCISVELSGDGETGELRARNGCDAGAVVKICVEGSSGSECTSTWLGAGEGLTTSTSVGPGELTQKVLATGARSGDVAWDCAAKVEGWEEFGN